MSDFAPNLNADYLSLRVKLWIAKKPPFRARNILHRHLVHIYFKLDLTKTSHKSVYFFPPGFELPALFLENSSLVFSCKQEPF